MNLFASKKGQVENYFVPILMLFSIGVMTIIGFLTFTSFVDGFKETQFYDNETMDPVVENFKAGYFIIDTLIVVLLVVALIAIGLTSFRVNASPGFFIVSIISGTALVVVSFFFNFLFIEIVSNEVFNGVVAFFPKTILVCTNLHWVALAGFVIGSITLYAKKEKGEF